MNNGKDRVAAGRPRRSQLSRQLLMQYVLTIIGAGLLLVGSIFGLWMFCQQFTWQVDDPLYWVLKGIQSNLLFYIILLFGALWIGVTYYFLNRPLRYLDEVVAASEQLAEPNDGPIQLPAAMKNVQDKLNLIRQQAVNNARAAKEAEQRKNDLVVYLAHDLKTPLTSVIGYLTLLKDEPELSPQMRARYTEIALEKAERLEDLTNEFFDITRFNLSHLTLELGTVDLTRMLQQVVSEFEPLLAEKQLHCELELPETLECVCDPDKMARVLDNLLRNACNYSFTGGPIRIAAEKQEQRVQLVVENTGRTIPAENLGRIFDQFFRLDSSRQSHTGGSGLGLAIAKQIVELHGGSIRAESAEEKVRFVLELPLVQPG